MFIMDIMVKFRCHPTDIDEVTRILVSSVLSVDSAHILTYMTKHEAKHISTALFHFVFQMYCNSTSWI